MAASIGDKVTDTRNAARPNSAKVSSGRSAGATTLACDNLTGWPTASKVHFVTYQIDSNSDPVAGTQLDCTGIVSGNNIGSFTVIDGTDTGNAINDVVEMLPTAAWGQDLADALTAQHTRTGTHKSVTSTGGITTDTLTASGNVSVGGTLAVTGVANFTAVPLLPNNTVETADIQAAAVTAAKMQYGMVRQRQGGTTGDGSWATAGTSNTDTSAKAVFMQTGTVNSSSAAAVTVTFPVAFTQAPVVLLTSILVNGLVIPELDTAATTTAFTFSVYNTADTRQNNIPTHWLAIGQ